MGFEKTTKILNKVFIKFVHFLVLRNIVEHPFHSMPQLLEQVSVFGRNVVGLIGVPACRCAQCVINSHLQRFFVVRNAVFTVKGF